MQPVFHKAGIATGRNRAPITKERNVNILIPVKRPSLENELNVNSW
jgi:hypothetical protein